MKTKKQALLFGGYEKLKEKRKRFNGKDLASRLGKMVAHGRIKRPISYPGKTKTVVVDKEVGAILEKFAGIPGADPVELVRFLSKAKNLRYCFDRLGFYDEEKVIELVINNSAIIRPFKGREKKEIEKVSECIRKILFWINRQVYVKWWRFAFYESKKIPKDIIEMDKHLREICMKFEE